MRCEVERIDDKILDLVRQREQIASEIGLVKLKDGLPFTDKSREKQVKDNYVAKAGRIGCDKAAARKLAELLISDAVKVQRRKVRKDLTGKTALVVGGSGRMGSWFCRRLSNRGAAVSVWDTRGTLDGYENVSDLGAAARASDIVVVSSPLGAAPLELEQVFASKPRGLVFDVCSVKSHITGQLKRAARSGVKVASIHPMFGPSVATPAGRNVIICDCGSARGASAAERLVAGSGARTVRIRLEEHDKLMAYVLGLSHVNTMLFATTLANSGRPLKDFERVQGPSFERMVAISKELTKESVRVYHDIQSLNPNTQRMFSKYINTVKLLFRVSIKDDSAEFRKLMESNSEYLEVR